MGASATASDLPGVGGSLALTLLSLGLVCLAAYVMLRWLARRGLGRSDAGMRVVGRCLLEPRRSVYLIEVCGRCFLVGVSEGPMSLLAEIDRTALPAEDSQPGTGSSFAELIARMLGKGRGR